MSDNKLLLGGAGVAFGAAAVALLGAAVRSARQTMRLRRTGARSTAIVRELNTVESFEDTAYAPAFEFATADGTVHRIVSDAAANPPSHNVGDEVTVLYDPADPSGAQIEAFASLWLGPVLMMVGGNVTLGVAIFCLWFTR